MLLSKRGQINYSCLNRGVASRSSIDRSPKVYGGLFDAIALFTRNHYTAYNALLVAAGHLFIQTSTCLSDTLVDGISRYCSQKPVHVQI